MPLELDYRWRLTEPPGDGPEPALFALLEAVAATGSLRQAAQAVGLSYRHAWGLVGRWTGLLGQPLLNLERGRGAPLAPMGTKLLEIEVTRPRPPRAAARCAVPGGRPDVHIRTPGCKSEEGHNGGGLRRMDRNIYLSCPEPQGVVTHVIEYVRNITDRKRAEQESHRFIKELEKLSSEDSLTGLQNRRMIFERIKHEIERVRRYKADLSLIFCDLDSFKEINDTYGHNAGDGVLRATADILRRSVRTSDVVGRYGGDEFLVVLPQTSLNGAQELSERVRCRKLFARADRPE